MAKAFLLGILASMFFAVTFVLNRQMGLAGGHWIWTSSLRFYYMLPMLFALLLPKRRYRLVLAEIRNAKFAWILWSTVGFGLFYSAICVASAYGPSWLIAATWQVTIVAGAILSPFLRQGGDFSAEGSLRRKGIPQRQLMVSAAILAGAALLQIREVSAVPAGDAILGAAFVLIAAFAYPLGNRKMMELAGGRLSTLERVAGMTLCSMPFWLAISLFGLFLGVLPTKAQYLQSFVVALFSGVAATLLFFKATDMVRADSGRLAAVESTQAGEVVFALLGGILVFGDRGPDQVGYIGITIVILGLALNGPPGRVKR